MFTLILLTMILTLSFICLIPHSTKAEGIRDLELCLITSYGLKRTQAKDDVSRLLATMALTDQEVADRWKQLMEVWEDTDGNPDIGSTFLPAYHDIDDNLCVIVLGYKLLPDGSMTDELIARLLVAEMCARRYPRAMILCSGGGTADNVKNVSEAKCMADWLVMKGISPSRILIDEQSLTTVENVLCSCKLLENKFPKVQKLCIVSSRYHIPRSLLLFKAHILLNQRKQFQLPVFYASCDIKPSDVMPIGLDALGLLEIRGYKEEADMLIRKYTDGISLTTTDGISLTT